MTSAPVLREPLPWFARLLLRRPRQIQENLDRIAEAGIMERVPNGEGCDMPVATRGLLLEYARLGRRAARLDVPRPRLRAHRNA